MDAQAAEPTAHEGWYSLIKTEKGVWTGVIFVGWDSVEVSCFLHPYMQQEWS